MSKMIVAYTKAQLKEALEQKKSEFYNAAFSSFELENMESTLGNIKDSLAEPQNDDEGSQNEVFPLMLSKSEITHVEHSEIPCHVGHSKITPYHLKNKSEITTCHVENENETSNESKIALRHVERSKTSQNLDSQNKKDSSVSLANDTKRHVEGYAQNISYSNLKNHDYTNKQNDTKNPNKNIRQNNPAKITIPKKVPKIGLVPTMGALHDGHKSLMSASVSENDISVVSIFLNPTQFSANEDLDKYPKSLDSDLAMCERMGIDIVFCPSANEMYDDDEIVLHPPKAMGYILEGYHRPSHFAGVLQIVLKLFNLTLPTHAYFGRKDAQQLLIIKKMVEQLCLDVVIRDMPIVRDSDGLALSSRNVYLNSEDRKKALGIKEAIFFIEKHKDSMDIESLRTSAREILKDLQVDYMDFYDYNLRLSDDKSGSIFLVCARVGGVRLLDNLWL